MPWCQIGPRFTTLSTLQLRAIDRTHSRAGEPDQSQTPLSLPRGSNFFSNSVEATLVLLQQCAVQPVLWVKGDCGCFWVLLVPWVLECGNAHGKRCSIIWIKAALLPPETDPSPSILPFQTFVTFRAAAQVFNATPHPHQFFSFTFASTSSGDTFNGLLYYECV